MVKKRWRIRSCARHTNAHKSRLFFNFWFLSELPTRIKDYKNINKQNFFVKQLKIVFQIKMLPLWPSINPSLIGSLLIDQGSGTASNEEQEIKWVYRILKNLKFFTEIMMLQCTWRRTTNIFKSCWSNCTRYYTTWKT